MSWTRKLLPQSLRNRLILAFGVLIFFSLFLAGFTTIYLLKTEQERAARDRVGRLAEPVAQSAAFLQANGITDPNELQAVLEEEYAVRILLIDGDATVVADSGQTLRGETISQLIAQGVEARPLEETQIPRQPLQAGPGESAPVQLAPRRAAPPSPASRSPSCRDTRR